MFYCSLSLEPALMVQKEQGYRTGSCPEQGQR